jgi:hypothetical protein
LSHGVWNPILGVAVGAVYSASLRPARKEYLDNLMAGASLDFPLWGLISVIAMPLISGQRPEWNAEEMRQHLPALVAWVVFGASLGIITKVLNDVAERFLGSEPGPKLSAASLKNRIIILGGGFAAYCATVLYGLALQSRDGASRTTLTRVVELAMANWQEEVDKANKSGRAIEVKNAG